jgi:uncharacterized protein YbbC (DUF1343 family)
VWCTAISLEPDCIMPRRRASLLRILPVLLGLALASGACTSEPGAEAAGARDDAGSAAPAGSAVHPGLDVLLADSIHRVAGMRVGLVTNHTAIDAEGRHAIDRLHEHPEVELVALFAPEHGIRGTAEAGVRIDPTVDEATGTPVHSLYGETRKPTPDMLQGLDVLLFDIQDIGTRYYTYVYTMALAMEAAGEAGLPFVVLDRPNPVGGEAVQGNVLDPDFASFVGMYPIPMRHGMTPGELARLFRAEFGVEADLTVIPAEGWRRAMLFPDTGLPWRPPSPNMPDLESALHYPGTCLFEGTNLSVGRGTPRAFQQVGAPWLDGPALAAAMDAHDLPGVRFEAVRFTPENPGDGKFAGQEVSGVRLVVTDPGRHDPARVGALLVTEAHRLSGDAWSWIPSHFDRLAGTDALRQTIERALAGGDDLPALLASWDAEAAAFRTLRSSHLLYP